MLIAIIIYLISTIPTYLRILLIISMIIVIYLTLSKNADIAIEIGDNFYTSTFLIVTYISYYIMQKVSNDKPFQFFKENLPLSLKFLLIIDCIILISIIIQTASSIEFKRNIIPSVLIKLALIIIPAIIIAKLTFSIIIITLIILFILSCIGGHIYF